MTAALEIRRHAVLSGCLRYRYALTRDWAGTDLLSTSTTATFIMLNPSTADAEVDDPTIRRCIRFARDWGHAKLLVVNLYALRATKPADLWTVDDPVGPGNDHALELALLNPRWGDVTVAAWGANAKPDRVAHVAAMARSAGVPLRALAVNRDGSPAHPLYQPTSAVPITWEAP